jgi:hypothetical protein
MATNQLRNTVIGDGFSLAFGTPFKIQRNTTSGRLEFLDASGNVMLALADDGAVGRLDLTGNVRLEPAKALQWKNAAGSYLSNLWYTANNELILNSQSQAGTAPNFVGGSVKIQTAGVDRLVVEYSGQVTATAGINSTGYKVSGTALASRHLADMPVPVAVDDGKALIYNHSTGKFVLSVATGGSATVEFLHAVGDVASYSEDLGNGSIPVYDTADSQWHDRVVHGGGTLDQTGLLTVIGSQHSHVEAQLTYSLGGATDLDLASRADGYTLLWDEATSKYVHAASAVLTMDAIGDWADYDSLGDGHIPIRDGNLWKNRGVYWGGTLAKDGKLEIDGSKHTHTEGQLTYTLQGATDLDWGTPAAGQTLCWNGTAAVWLDPSEVGPLAVLFNIGDVVDYSGTIAAGQFLVRNATNHWEAVDLSGDATLDDAGALTLADSGAAAGSYSGALAVTVDEKGRITSIAETTVTLPTVALGTDTSGNYVADVDGTEGRIAVTGSAGEGWTPVVDLAIIGSGGSGEYTTYDVYGRVTASARRRMSFQLTATGLQPTASGGCSAPALDANNRWGAAFTTGQTGVWNFLLPTDYPGLSKVTIVTSGNGSQEWELYTAVVANAGAANTALSAFATTITVSPTTGNLAIGSDATNFADLLGSAGANAGKYVTLQVKCKTGSGTLHDLILEWA